MTTTSSSVSKHLSQLPRWQHMLIAMGLCILTTLIATVLHQYLALDLVNIVMLFLLTVLMVAVTTGRDSAVMASVLSVVLFDIFFVPPRFSLTVSNIQYLITFAVMLVTALVTTHLTAGLKQRAEESQLREQTTQALYALARELAGTLNLVQVHEAVQRFIEQQISAKSWIQISDDQGTTLAADMPPAPFVIEAHMVNAAVNSGQLIFSQSPPDSGYASLYLSLRAATHSRGVLAIELSTESPDLPPERRALIEAMGSLAAVAVERLHYVGVVQSTQMNMISERLRSSILSALSHDLRTPLTALVGLADSLFLVKPKLPDAALDTAQAMHEQAARLANLVSNLLDMARLNAGNVSLRREWQPLDDVIGASIKLLGAALQSHPVQVRLPMDLPLLEFDAVLMERVFCNLLENSAKYAPANTSIEITAEAAPDHVSVRISDCGPGFPLDRKEELFAMFSRGRAESTEIGAGLGLAICRAIVEAHGGSIGVENLETGGSVVFTLPRGKPPVVEAERL